MPPKGVSFARRICTGYAGRCLLLAIMAVTSSCGHAARPSDTGTLGEGTAGTCGRSEAEPASNAHLPDLSGLGLFLRQVASETEVIIEFALTNTGSSPVKITDNPRFGDREFCGVRRDEFEIQIMDSRGRLISYRCSDMRGPHQPIQTVLQPGQSQVFSHTLWNACYSLVAGERLSFIATFADLFDTELSQRRRLPVVHAEGWIDLVVPQGWREDDGKVEVKPGAKPAETTKPK